MYRAVSLFSGIGGIDLAFALAGFDITAQVEIDPYCREVLRKHAGQYWPNAAQFTDVRTVGADELGEADVIFGGFPCQNISIAGKGAGLAGEQSGLWYEFRRIIGEVRPQFVFLENVPAITFRGGVEVVGHLAALGYDARWGIVAASDAGAPHRRERWWCVGYRDGLGHDLSTDAGINGGALRQTSTGAHDAAEPERTRPVWQQPAGDASGLGLEARGHQPASVRQTALADAAGTADGGRMEYADRFGPSTRAPFGALSSVNANSDGGEPEWWRAESRMGRDADGLPARIHGHRNGTGGLNDKQMGSTQEGSTSNSNTRKLRDVRGNWSATREASRGLPETIGSDDSVPHMPLTQRTREWSAETEGSENLSDLRGGIHALYALTESDVQSSMFERTGAYQRQEKMASNIVAHRFPAGPGPQHPWEPPRQIVSRGPHWKHRVKALGNSVVPQCVYPFAVEIMRLLEAD